MTAIILTTARNGSVEISEEVGENDSMTRGSRLLGEVFEVFRGGVVYYRVSYVVS